MVLRRQNISLFSSSWSVTLVSASVYLVLFPADRLYQNSGVVFRGGGECKEMWLLISHEIEFFWPLFTHSSQVPANWQLLWLPPLHPVGKGGIPALRWWGCGARASRRRAEAMDSRLLVTFILSRGRGTQSTEWSSRGCRRQALE